MVSGNSMAHVYLGLGTRTRQPWADLAPEWLPRTEAVLSHPAIDLVASMQGPAGVEVRRGGHRAEIAVSAKGLSYRPTEGNPLGSSRSRISAIRLRTNGPRAANTRMVWFSLPGLCWRSAQATWW
jgi:hypothetical protein